MALKVIYNGEETTLKLCEYLSSENLIICSPDNEPSSRIHLYCPLKLDNQYNPSNFTSALFRKKNIAENDVFTVFDAVDDSRLGRCFPIQALCSIDHSYANEDNFLKFSFIAVYHLIENLNICTWRIPIVQDSDTLSFSDFVSDDAAILIISLGTPGSRKEFNHKDWLPSLFKYGFIPVNDKYNQEIFYCGTNTGNNSLKIQKISKDIKNTKFILNTIENILPYENNCLLRFFYLYQIIELFIYQVYEEEYPSYIKSLVDNAGDTIKAKDLISKISELATEKKRINLLVNDFVFAGLERAALINSCNAYLTLIGREECPDVQQAIYRVRNILFHQFRDVPDGSSSFLEDLCDEFSIFIVQLLSLYKNKAATVFLEYQI